MKLGISSLSNLPGLTGQADVLRQIQLLPGVSGTDDLSANLRVRGGDTGENMFLLDDMPLYNVTHYYGIFSAIQPDIIEQVTLNKNIFPIEYNGKTSSVVRLQTDTSIAKKIRGNIGIDRYLVSGMVKMPLRSDMDVTFGGRVSYQDIGESDFARTNDENQRRFDRQKPQDPDSNRESIFSLQPASRFSDFYGKWQWDINQTDWIRVSGFYGKDKLDGRYTNRFSVFERFSSRLVQETYAQEAEWKNTALGLTFYKRWTPKWATVLQASISNYGLDSKSFFSLRNVQVNNGGRPEVDFARAGVVQRNEVQGQQIILKQQVDLSDHDQITFGYGYFKDQVDMNLTNITGRKTDFFDYIGGAGRHQLFGAYALDGQDLPISLELGWNVNYYDLNNQLYHSPRVAFSYQPIKGVKLKSSWSQYNQFTRQLTHENYFGARRQFWILGNDEEIPVARTNQLMIGSRIKWKGWLLDVEAYEKTTDGALEYSLLNPGFDPTEPGLQPSSDFYLYEGKGNVKGIDVLLQKSWKRYIGWLSYTLSKSEQQFESINFGQPFAAQDDRRHQLKWVNTYQLNRWQFSINYLFASGRPYFDYTFLDGPEERRKNGFDNAIKRLEDYHRFDIGVNYNLPFKKRSLQAGVSVLNLFNHQNVKYRHFIYSFESQRASDPKGQIIGTEFDLLDRQINFNLNLKF